jgi:hypothetical protein
MYKAEKRGDNWCVVLNKGNIVVCTIGHWFREDKSVAEGLVKLLNENNKIVFDLTV